MDAEVKPTVQATEEAVRLLRAMLVPWAHVPCAGHTDTVGCASSAAKHIEQGGCDGCSTRLSTNALPCLLHPSWQALECDLGTVCMQVRKRELEEKKKVYESLQKGKPVVAAAGCLDEEEDEEAEPDLEIEVPKHKVKLIIGAGGENIKQIQRRTKTRIQVRSSIVHALPTSTTRPGSSSTLQVPPWQVVQLRKLSCGGVQVKKEAKELERQFGSGAQIRLPGKIAALVRDINGTDVEMATIMIFGEPHKCEQARAMLLEAVDNRDQKQKQRQKVCCSVCLIHEFVVGIPGYELRSAGAG